MEATGYIAPEATVVGELSEVVNGDNGSRVIYTK
jgi:hypothetical protein